MFKESIREVKKLQKKFKNAFIVSSKNGWMSGELTKDWLDKVYVKIAFTKRILAWDSYRCHISDDTKII